MEKHGRGSAEDAWWEEYGDDYREMKAKVERGEISEEELRAWFNAPETDEAIWTDFGPTKIARITASFPPDHWTNQP